MPRRNLHILLVLAVLCLICAVKVSRHGRVLVYAMDQINSRYLEKVDEEVLFEGAMEGMLSRLDEYSEYIPPAALTEFQETLDNQFGGIGIEILLDPDTKQLTVASPLVGSPAYEAGIQAGDKILRIDGRSTQGFSLADAAERLRGEPGEPVVLTILHPDQTEPVDVEIFRDIVHVDTVVGDTRNADGSWNFFLEGHDEIGYVRLNSFSEKTETELEQALNGLIERKMKGLILDLRNNPGGLLSSAVNICDMFITSGVIVTTRDRNGEIETAYEASGTGKHTDFPIVILVNQFTASASEIVAACLQDHQRAVIVGQRSFGKGTVQEILDLEPGQGVLKLTMASYWRPSGKNIHRRLNATSWGVSPDPACEVVVDGQDLAKLLRWRNQRDLYKPNGAPNAPHADPADPQIDPQLAKALECVEKAMAKREK
jgi:carboxyl-terminal processing protease